MRMRVRYKSNADDKLGSYESGARSPARNESHDEGSTAANSFWGENQSRADRSRLRLGCASSVRVVCVGWTPSFSARTVCTCMCGVAGGRHRYGWGSGDADVDAESTQFALLNVSGEECAWRDLPRPGEREYERRLGGEVERRGNARRMGFKKLDVRDFLSTRVCVAMVVRRGSGGGPEAMIGESFSGIDRGDEDVPDVRNENAGQGTDSGCDDDCAVVAVTVKNENAGVWFVDVPAWGEGLSHEHSRCQLRSVSFCCAGARVLSSPRSSPSTGDSGRAESWESYGVSIVGYSSMSWSSVAGVMIIPMSSRESPYGYGDAFAVGIELATSGEYMYPSWCGESADSSAVCIDDAVADSIVTLLS